jgi:uracil-DNA glycosylase family 4
MLSKPDGCKECPLYEKGKGFVPDAVAPHAEVVFIGEAPGKNEVEQAVPFVGKAGYVLKEWLLKAVPTLKILDEKKKVTYANTLRCLPPELQGRAYPRGEERVAAEECCRQYDDFGSAHTFILFGDSPQRCFFRDELGAEDVVDRQLQHDQKGVMGRVGREYQRDGKRWVFAPHPAFILRQPSLVEHGQAALRIAAQTERVAEVEYVDWSSIC